MKNKDGTYPLIGSQEMVRFMWKYSPHKQATQIPCAVAFDEQLDFKTLARAVNIEIARNDCLRLRLVKTGGEIRQYFMPEYKLERIAVRTFATGEDLRNGLDRESGKALKVFGGETFRILFFNAPEGRSGVYLLVSHVIMDAMATFIFFKDLMAVYDALKTGADLPKPLAGYEMLIRKELEDPDRAAYVKSETDILAEYVKMDCPPAYCSLKGDRRNRPAEKLHRPNPCIEYFPLLDKTHFSRFSLTEEDSALIRSFVKERQISAEWVIQLGLRVCLSALNGRVNDTVFWVLCPRRRTVKEKRAGGTLASPMPWREQLPGELTFNEGLLRLASTQNFLFRHADVPFTEMRDNERKLFGYNPMQTCSSTMFSYLPLDDDTFGGRGYEFMGFDMGRYVMPLYTVTLYDAKSGCYRFNYIHRTHVYSDEDIRRFHGRAVRAVLAGVRNPEITLNEIMEEI